MPKSLSVPARSPFVPAADQSTVTHIRITVQAVKPLPDGSLRLEVVSGNVGFDLHIPNLPDRPPFKPGDALLIEHPKGSNFMTTHYSAIYPAHIKPESKTMNALTTITTEALTMSSREIATLVESRHTDVCRTIERLIEKAVIGGCAPTAYTHEQNGQQYNEYHLIKRDSLIVVAQLSPEFTARLVDRWQELESKVGAGSTALPRSFAEALRLAADLADQKALVERQRDEAIATKMLIGSKREATAMNTAAIAVKKASKLEIELDRNKQYATVKRMEMLYHGQKFNWRLLKEAAASMGIPPIDGFDANYGTVKSYHTDVWREAYAVEIIGEMEAA